MAYWLHLTNGARTSVGAHILTLEAQRDELAQQLEQAEQRLRLIARNAESWHHDDAAKGRALYVIANWAHGGKLPESLVRNDAAALTTPDPPVEAKEEG